ncbi:MAG: hypothetical protein ACRECV_10315 [Xanthobacteraceae bacterium]
MTGQKVTGTLRRVFGAQSMSKNLGRRGQNLNNARRCGGFSVVLTSYTRMGTLRRPRQTAMRARTAADIAVTGSVSQRFDRPLVNRKNASNAAEIVDFRLIGKRMGSADAESGSPRL